MRSVFDAVREVLGLASRLGTIRSDLDQLAARLADHHERIIRLEAREDFLIERTARVAVEESGKQASALYSRIAALEQHCGLSAGPSAASPGRKKK